MLTCPVCKSLLREEVSGASCENGHRFDRAKEGYLNLLMTSSTRGHGDDKAMLLARRAFLEKGYYEPLLSALKKAAGLYLPEGGAFLDAGCGEGYYTEGILRFLQNGGKRPELFAFDVSKEAVRLTAKRMKGEGRFFVASTFAIPVARESVDLAFSLFAPYSEEEFLRVLKPGGYLIRAVPLEEHLYSLKAAVYENPVKNLSVATVGEGFLLEKEIRVRDSIRLSSNEDIRHLFEMTPYAHKTSPRDMQKLEGMESLTTEMDVGILIYRRKP